MHVLGRGHRPRIVARTRPATPVAPKRTLPPYAGYARPPNVTNAERQTGIPIVLDCVAKQSQRTILTRVHKAACLALPRDLSRWPLCNLCQKPVPGLRT